MRTPGAFAGIQRDSPVPFYHQLEEALREQIEGGVWRASQALPSEHELCERYRVSRPVVRQALDRLVRDGLIHRVKGRGSFVAEPKITDRLMQRLTGFHEDVVSRGLPLRTRVLELAVVAAPARVAEKLALPLDRQVIKLVRLRFVRDEPVLCSTTYLPYELCADLLSEDFTTQSLYTLLEQKLGLAPQRGQRSIEAVAADGHDADCLGVPLNAPIILMECLTWAYGGCPIEYSVVRLRGDRTKFEVDLTRG